MTVDDVKDKDGAGGCVGPCVSRRRFAAWGLWAILGVMAASAAWPVVELITRKTAGKKLVFFKALPLSEMPEAGIKKVEFNVRGGDRPDTRVFLRRDADGTLTALSAVCTHLGCIVNWNRFKGEFICPCHAGRYDQTGKVLGGPPTAPLAKLPVKVEGQDIYIGIRT